MTTTDDKLDAILAALGTLNERVEKLETAKPTPDADDELAAQYALDPESVCAWCHNYPIELGEPCGRCGNRAARGPQADPPMGTAVVEQTPLGPKITLPPPSDDRKEQRRMLERQQLRLAMALGDTSQDWNELYAEGGPWWLYSANRELVVTYPPYVLKTMILDLEQDSPKLAYEMGNDVLKEPCGEPDMETGSGALHVSNLTSQEVKRHA